MSAKWLPSWRGLSCDEGRRGPVCCHCECEIIAVERTDGQVTVEETSSQLVPQFAPEPEQFVASFPSDAVVPIDGDDEPQDAVESPPQEEEVPQKEPGREDVLLEPINLTGTWLCTEISGDPAAYVHSFTAVPWLLRVAVLKYGKLFAYGKDRWTMTIDHNAETHHVSIEEHGMIRVQYEYDITGEWQSVENKMVKVRTLAEFIDGGRAEYRTTTDHKGNHEHWQKRWLENGGNTLMADFISPTGVKMCITFTKKDPGAADQVAKSASVLLNMWPRRSDSEVLVSVTSK